MGSKKAHGTTAVPVQDKLRWGADRSTADRICCFNRHYAEHSGYFRKTSFLSQVDKKGMTTYYDSVTGQPLFIAPVGRSFKDFERESKSHGWPSFRDQGSSGKTFVVCRMASACQRPARTLATTCLIAVAIATASTSSPSRECGQLRIPIPIEESQSPPM